jgi:pilus assembly protein CpaF
MLQAMNTGHDGSMTTLHANSPGDAISRMITMCLMSDLELPTRSIMEQIGSAISLIVQVSRMVDGSRKITKICEITGVEDSVVKTSIIFEFKETGYDASGRVLGNFVCRNSDPLVFRQLKEHRIEVPELPSDADATDKTDNLSV